MKDNNYVALNSKRKAISPAKFLIEKNNVASQPKLFPASQLL